MLFNCISFLLLVGTSFNMLVSVINYTNLYLNSAGVLNLIYIIVFIVLMLLYVKRNRSIIIKMDEDNNLFLNDFFFPFFFSIFVPMAVRLIDLPFCISRYYYYGFTSFDIKIFVSLFPKDAILFVITDIISILLMIYGIHNLNNFKILITLDDYFIADVNKNNYHSLADNCSISDSRQNTALLRYHPGSYISDLNFMSPNSVFFISDMSVLNEIDDPVSHLREIFEQLQNYDCETGIIVLIDDKDLSDPLIRKLMYRKWITLLNYSGENYLELIKMAKIKSERKYTDYGVNDIYIRWMLEEIDQNKNTVSQIPLIKNFVMFVGTLLYYAISEEEGNHNAVPNDNIWQIYDYIEKHTESLPEKMRDLFTKKKIRLDSDSKSMLMTFNRETDISLKFGNLDELRFEDILFAINEISNKTFAHGICSLETINIIDDTLMLLLRCFINMTDVENLYITEMDCGCVELSYCNHKYYPASDKISITDFYPCIVFNKARKDSGRVHLVKRNYFEGSEFYPRDINI